MQENQIFTASPGSKSNASANNLSSKGKALPAVIATPVVQREALTPEVDDVKTFTGTLKTFVDEKAKRSVKLTDIFRSDYPPIKPAGEFGRPSKVTAEIDKIPKKERTGNKTILGNVVKMAKMEQQAILGGKEEFFHAGHIIGDALLSKEDSFQYGNLIPQTDKLNLEQYHVLEKKIKDHVAGNQDPVDVVAKVGYEGNYSLSLNELKEHEVIKTQLASKLQDHADDKISFPRWIPNTLTMKFKPRSGDKVDIENKTYGTKVPSLAGDKEPEELIQGYQYKLSKAAGKMDFKQWTPRVGNLAQLLYPALARFRSLESWEEQKKAVSEFYMPLNFFIFNISAAFNMVISSGALEKGGLNEIGRAEYEGFSRLVAELNLISMELTQNNQALLYGIEREKGLPKIEKILELALLWFTTIVAKYEMIPDPVKDTIRQTREDLEENVSVIESIVEEALS